MTKRVQHVTEEGIFLVQSIIRNRSLLVIWSGVFRDNLYVSIQVPPITRWFPATARFSCLTLSFGSHPARNGGPIFTICMSFDVFRAKKYLFVVTVGDLPILVVYS